MYRCIVLQNPKELLLFFRTLLGHPRHRLLVRSLAWLGVSMPLRPSRENAFADLYPLEGEDHAVPFTPECWALVTSELLKSDNLEAFQAAKLMRLHHCQDDTCLQAPWRVLGLVLLILSTGDLKSFFAFQG
jgi:hypothetical protein